MGGRKAIQAANAVHLSNWATSSDLRDTPDGQERRPDPCHDVSLTTRCGRRDAGLIDQWRYGFFNGVAAGCQWQYLRGWRQQTRGAGPHTEMPKMVRLEDKNIPGLFNAQWCWDGQTTPLTRNRLWP